MSLSESDAASLSAYLANITSNTELDAGYTINPDSLCAMGAVLLQSGEESVSKIGYNKLIEVVLRGKKSFMVISSAGRFFLIGASQVIKDLGKTVTVFRYYAGKIAELYP